MIKVENIIPPSISQWEAVIRGMRNPLNSWAKSDTTWDIIEDPSPINPYDMVYIKIGDNDLDLMRRLAKAGSDHRKYLRMLPVWMDITAPLYWIAEHDTYKVATVRNSCSFMHKGCAKPFEISDFSIPGPTARKKIEEDIKVLNKLREDYLATKEESIFQEIRSILPSGYNQRYTWEANYEVLLNIYFSRRHHRLPEWRTFCEIIENEVPYFKEILLC